MLNKKWDNYVSEILGQKYGRVRPSDVAAEQQHLIKGEQEMLEQTLSNHCMVCTGIGVYQWASKCCQTLLNNILLKSYLTFWIWTTATT